MSKFDSNRDPWLAVNLSMFFPGIGQFYGGNFGRGIVFLVGQACLLTMGFWHIFATPGNTVNGFIYLSIATVVYLVNILDSHLSIYYKYREKILEKIPRKRKNPWFAVFVSRILPGLGHLYLQKPIIGLILLTFTLVFLKLDDFFVPLLIVVPTVSAIATYHSYLIFPRHHGNFQRSIISLMAGLVFFVSLIGNYLPLLIEQKFDKFIIPSESMKPSLQIGDMVLVTESTNYVPQRGDIVVFTASEAIKAQDPEPSDYYIKRVIGKPGEIFEINNGKVYINNRPLNEPYIAEPPQYRLNAEVIPNSSYLVLGDNRNNSFDSHFWGFLPKKNIVGKAYKICWPPDRIQPLE
ncbi:MAG TPA: signal peptidase I [Cyanothece sp. UBA12306]|nr:signal peptidase I [Cyanothece sp. UBA12306]